MSLLILGKQAKGCLKIRIGVSAREILDELCSGRSGRRREAPGFSCKMEMDSNHFLVSQDFKINTKPPWYILILFLFFFFSCCLLKVMMNFLLWVVVEIKSLYRPWYAGALSTPIQVRIQCAFAAHQTPSSLSALRDGRHLSCLVAAGN